MTLKKKTGSETRSRSELQEKTGAKPPEIKIQIRLSKRPDADPDPTSKFSEAPKKVPKKRWQLSSRESEGRG